jgi:hypothetical protein
MSGISRHFAARQNFVAIVQEQTWSGFRGILTRMTVAAGSRRTGDTRLPDRNGVRRCTTRTISSSHRAFRGRPVFLRHVFSRQTERAQERVQERAHNFHKSARRHPAPRSSGRSISAVAMAVRTLVNQQGALANIPPKRNRKEPICYLYRGRNLVERFFNEIQQCRRIATRYDKRAANHLAFIKLAAIRIWLRACESAARRPPRTEPASHSTSVGLLPRDTPSLPHRRQDW